MAQRVAQLQEALLHCGKFQDALEPLLSWLTDTEELISNQKPPSAEYKVVKAQIQEQKVSKYRVRVGLMGGGALDSQTVFWGSNCKRQGIAGMSISLLLSWWLFYILM